MDANFGQFARLKRKQANLSQDTVAQAFDFAHRSEVSRLESGKIEWKLKQVEILAELLGMTTSKLLAEYENS